MMKYPDMQKHKKFAMQKNVPNCCALEIRVTRLGEFSPVWAIVFFGHLFSLGICFLWALVFFGRLFSLGDCFLWAIVFFGRLFSLGRFVANYKRRHNFGA
jgi:hypothetical protein